MEDGEVWCEAYRVILDKYRADIAIPRRRLAFRFSPKSLSNTLLPSATLAVYPISHIELVETMAEPISMASGLLTLAAFAFKSSVALYGTVKSFQSHSQRVRDLMEELEALSAVLGPLTDQVSARTDVEFPALDLPLLRCGKACEEFQQELMKCSLRSGGSRTSFRDWAKLRYMGDDIDGFRRLLAGYKLTINIALTDANL
jgi:hypothetical protein